MNKIDFCKWFYDTRIGRSIDKDNVYGVQCVDALKDFNSEIGMPNPTMPIGGDGYAYNIYTRRYELGLMEYYTEHEVAEYGDWFVWKYGAKDCPYSHVAMFIADYDGKRGYFLGQNQDGKNGGYSVALISYEGSYNCLRLKDDKVPNKGVGNLATSGTFEFMFDGVRVRSEPSLSGEIVAHYNSGESVIYNNVVINEGYAWLEYIGASGNIRYVSAGEVTDNTLTYAYGKNI